MRMSEHSKITTAELAKILIDARARTLALVSDLTDEQLMGPRLPIVKFRSARPPKSLCVEAFKRSKTWGCA